MAVRDISLLGDPVLRTRVDPDWQSGLSGKALERLAVDMTDTMRAANGVGIAAPQLGESARLIAIEVRPENRYGVTDLVELMLVQDPEVEPVGTEAVETWEGCLSLPMLRGPVTRSQSIVLRGRELDGTPIEMPISGFPAVVAQHETDHVNGVLFIDRMESLELLSLEAEFRRFHQPPEPSPSLPEVE